MKRLPRGTCRYCNRRVALRKNGVLREHRNTIPGAGLCLGSGRPSKARRGGGPA